MAGYDLKAARGMRYRRFLAQLHQTNVVDWYMEIGCAQGDCIALSNSKTIAVDPFFKIERNVISAKPALFVFQQTSDSFFDSEIFERLDARLALTFLDGMHLFEFLLRDLINTEKHSDPEGMILMHDCYPFSVEMTTRDLTSLPSGAWTGDVWKMLPILREYRPELIVSMLDCKFTGLCALQGLDPNNTELEDNYDAILDDYSDMSIEDYGLEKFNEDFPLMDARAFLATDPLSKVRLSDSPEMPSWASPG